MLGYKEFVKQYNRMCNSYPGCDSGCGLLQLRYELGYELCINMCMSVNAMSEIEKIVEKWARENLVKKRRDVFIEKYKDKPWTKYINRGKCEKTKNCIMKIPCEHCEWWSEEIEDE